MDSKKALLLVGSPKKGKSSSFTIGEYIIENLDEEKYDREIMHLYSVYKSEESLQVLLEKVNEADLIVISSPLYVDTTPAIVIKILERVYKFRLENMPEKEQKLLAVSNCGFPESVHNIQHLQVYENFASKAGFRWIGGIPVGMGGALTGKSLRRIKGMARNLIKGLDLLISRLDEKMPVNDEVLKLVRKKFIPRWLYNFMATRGWKRMLKKNNVLKNVLDKPHTE